MRNWLLAILIFLSLSTPTSIGAQGSVKLESVNIELWSEYDQPSMLVINEFIVSPDTSLPAKVTLRFPKDGNLIAVAFESNGQLVNTQFETPTEQGDWQTIILNVDAYLPYRIEYYQALEREGNKRTFDFRWFGDYSIQKFDLIWQIPGDSTTITTVPPFSSVEVSSDGRHLIGSDSVAGLKMGQSYQFEIEYERNTDELTDPAAGNQVQPVEPIDESTPGRVSVDQLPWLIGLLGLALIGFALFFYWRSMRGIAPSASARRRAGRSSAGTEDPGNEVYCHECGTRSQSGDRFCRTCGSRLRPG